jgi:hypothetical protein
MRVSTADEIAAWIAERRHVLTGLLEHADVERRAA